MFTKITKIVVWKGKFYISIPDHAYNHTFYHFLGADSYYKLYVPGIVSNGF